MKTDILIVGSGCSGLYCALNLPREKQITIITKSDVKSSDSYLAQGGICMLKDDSDYDSYFEDTMKAGHYENDRESVSIMIRSSQDVIHDLIGFGVDFARDENGNLPEREHIRTSVSFFMRILQEKKLQASCLLLPASVRILPYWKIPGW